MSFCSGSKYVHLYLSGSKCADLPNRQTYAGGKPLLRRAVTEKHPDWDGLATSLPFQAQLTRLPVLTFERFFQGMQTVESLFLLTTFQDANVEPQVVWVFFPCSFYLWQENVSGSCKGISYFSSLSGDKKTSKPFPFNNQGFFFPAG